MSSDLVNRSCFPPNQNNLAGKNRKHPLPLSHAHREQNVNWKSDHCLEGKNVSLDTIASSEPDLLHTCDV